MPTPYHVRLAISQYGAQFRAELFTEDLGDTDGELLPADWRERFERWMDYLQGGGTLSADTDADIGAQLFDWLFGGAANRAKWAEVLKRVEQDRSRPLRLLIDSSTLAGPPGGDPDVDRVHNLPYGLLFDRQRGQFLFRPSPARPAVQYVRIVRRCTPRLLNIERARWPLRLLLAAAEPAGLEFDGAAQLARLARRLAALPGAFAGWLCTPEGSRPLAEALAGPPERWQPEALRRLCRTTRGQLQAALQGGPYDVLHLMAHGRGSGLLLCAPDGGPAEARAEELAEWCDPPCACAPPCAGRCRLNPRAQLAFLQVCRAARTGGRGAFGGLAQRLLNPDGGDLAAVVASPYVLEARQSTEAAVSFYEHLAGGELPDRALRRDLEMGNRGWAFLELWVRPSSLADTGTRGAFQFVSPYRGLARFEERDAEIFFGRDAEVAELWDILRTEPVVAVVGDSGSGKSSLLRAGLVPKVRREGLAGLAGWRIVSLRPGQQPGKSLLAALLRVEEGSAKELQVPQVEALRFLLADACRARHPLLLLFDQFEELFTLCTDEAQRRGVAEVLASAAEEYREHFRLVLGMRSEYLGSAAALPGLARHVRRPWVLRPPGRNDVRDIVAGPAAHCRYTFQGPPGDGDPRHRQGLLERILDDPLLPSEGGGAEAATPLPLLQFALERLWLEAVGRGSHEFTHADYDQIGGLGGAIAHHAEEVYQLLPTQTGLGPEAQRLAERVFTGVITSGGTRRPRRREELQKETGNEEAARRVIDHLVGERLLTIRSDPEDLAEGKVDIAHEVLRDRWARLREWLAESAESRALREEFQGDAERWDKGRPGTPPRSPRGLPSAEGARRYLVWLDTAGASLTPAQAAFAEALRAFLRRRRRLLLAGVTAALVVAAVMAVLAGVAEHQRGRAVQAEGVARNKEQEATAAKTKAQENEQKEKEARLAAQAARNRALAAEKEAKKQRDQAEWQFYLSNVALAHREWLANNPVRVEELLNECPGRHRNWEWHYLKRQTGAGLLTFVGHDFHPVWGVAFSPDGKRIASSGGPRDQPGTVLVWDAATGRVALTLRSFWGHSAEVRCVAFRPDAKVLASGGQDNKVVLWDATAGRYVRTLSGHTGAVTGVAFSPDGKLLASASRDRTVILWDPATGRKVRALKGHADAVQSVAFSPDGKRLASGGATNDPSVRVWDAATGKEVLKFGENPDGGHLGDVTGVAFRPDGKHLASACADGEVRVWDVATGQVVSRQGPYPPLTAVAYGGGHLAWAGREGSVRVCDARHYREAFTLRGHTDWLTGVAFSPDGRRLASAGQDGLVKVWDAQAGQESALLLPERVCAGAVLSPDGKQVAAITGDDAVVRVCDVATGRPVRNLRDPADKFLRVAFSPDGKVLASAGALGSVRVWRLAPGEGPLTLQGPAGKAAHFAAECTALAFGPGGRRLAWAGPDGTVRVWDTATNRQVLTFRSAHPISAGRLRLDGPTTVAFSPGGRRFASGGGDGLVRVWDATAGKLLHTLPGSVAIISAVAFSRDGRYLAAAWPTPAHSELKIWDLAAGREVLTFAGHSRKVYGLAFSPDGRRLASAGTDRTLRLWEVGTGWELPRLSLGGYSTVPIDSSLVFSADGSRLAYASGRGLRVWDATPGREVLTLSNHPTGVSSVAFSPDGKRLAYPDVSQVIIRDAATGRKVLTPRRRLTWGDAVGSSDPSKASLPVSVAFSPDGRLLAAGGGNALNLGEVRVWDTATGRVLHTLRQHKRGVSTVVFSPHGKRFASSSVDGTAKVWDTATGKVLVTFKGHTDQVKAVAFRPDGKRLASAGRDGVVRVWDAATGAEKQALRGHRHGILRVAFSPDGRHLASVGGPERDGEVKVWDLAAGKEAFACRGHTATVYGVAYSPDGRWLATGGDDRTVRVWEASTGREHLVLRGHLGGVNRVAFSPDGRLVASAGQDRSVRVWDVTDPRPGPATAGESGGE